jgi:hypothetical protein
MVFGDFFRDYGTPFATAVAVFNSVITVTVVQYFKDNPRARAVLVIASYLLGGVAVIATFYSQHEIVASRDAEVERRLKIREELGSFVAEGDSLMAICADTTNPIPIHQINEWAKKVETFLLTQLGQSYVSRFRDWTGIIPTSPTGLGGEHRDYYFYTYYRIFRLDQFSQQLSL